MSSNLLEKTKVEITGWETIFFRVAIPDLEQVTITAPHGWDWQKHAPLDTRKFIVKELDYDMRGSSTEALRLSRIGGVYFLKGDKHAGAKVASLVNGFITKEVIDQIPDRIWKYGRDYFDNEITPRLQEVLKTGIVIGDGNAKLV